MSYFSIHPLKNIHFSGIHSMEFHQEQLKKCCRVCGKRLLGAKEKKGKTHIFNCTDNKTLLLETFMIDVSSHDSTIHPQYFCLACHSVGRRKTQAMEKSLPYREGNRIFQWLPHRDNCEVILPTPLPHSFFTYFLTKRRVHIFTLYAVEEGEKKHSNKGRAPGETPKAVITSATLIAPSSFFSDSSPHVYTQTSLSIVGNTAFCPVCTDVLERPLEMQCGRMICLGCLTKWI